MEKNSISHLRLGDQRIFALQRNILLDQTPSSPELVYEKKVLSNTFKFITQNMYIGVKVSDKTVNAKKSFIYHHYN